jgi:hypothetical protein
MKISIVLKFRQKEFPFLLWEQEVVGSNPTSANNDMYIFIFIVI